jgi:alkylhydroperoxidase/carboxymuconolactone decarboxylase family protein YurZ
MALDTAAGAEEGARALANAALQAGATREEIAEYHLTGVGALYTVESTQGCDARGLTTPLRT